MKDEQEQSDGPGWLPTPKPRWKKCRLQPREFKVAGIGVGAVASQEYYVLQQQWHIPNSEQYEWRDVPAVREEQDE